MLTLRQTSAVHTVWSRQRQNMSNMAGAGGFPDLQLKMSKKIAQLTKVIYHLNSVNEDHQHELATKSAQHEKQVQELIADSKEKIRKLQAASDSRQDVANLEAKLEQLRQKHAKEKEAAIGEIRQLKQQTSVREKKMKETFDDETIRLREEVLAVKSQGQETLRRLAETLRTIQKERDALSTASETQAAELAARHQMELDDLVRSSNQKYNEMLAQQIALREAQENEAKETLRDAISKADTEKMNALGQLRASMKGAHQSELLELSKGHTRDLDATRQDLLGKLALAESAREEVQGRLATLEGEFEALQRDRDAAEQALARSEKDLAAARAECDALREDLSRRLSNANESAEAEATKLSEAQATIVSLRAQVATLEGEKERYSRATLLAGEERQLMTEKHEAFQQRMSDEMVRRDAELAGTRAQIAELQRKLSAEEDTRQQAQHRLAEAQSRIVVLEAQLEELRQQLERVREGAAKDLVDEKRALERKMQEREEHHKQEVDELASQARADAERHAQTLCEAQDAHAAALAEFKSQAEARESELRQQAEDEAARSADAFKEKLDALTAAHSSEVAKLKSSMKSLTDQLADEQRRSSGDHAALQERVNALGSELESCKRNLVAAKQESHEWENACESLKIQVEDLRSKMETERRAAEQKLKAELASLESDWSARLAKAEESAKTELESRLKELATEKDRAFATERERLESGHEERVQRLEQKLGDLQRSLQALQTSTSESMKRQEGMHHQQQRDLEMQIKRLNEKHDADLSQLQQRHEQALAELSEQLTSDRDAKLQDLENAHSVDRAELLQGHQEELDRLKLDRERERTEFQQTASKRLEEALQVAGQERVDALSAQAEDQQKAEEARVAALTDRFDSERRKLVEELTLANTNLLDKTSQCAALENDLGRRTEELQLTRASLEADIETQRTLAEERERKLRSTHASECETLRRQHEYDVESLRRDLQGKYDELNSEFMALQHRWETRESRPEDVARIEELTQQMKDMKRLVKKTQEEMIYFKRELLNREENFNKRFNANPNVGVMQVIKPKDAKQPPGKAGGKRPSGGKSHRPLAANFPGASSQSLSVGRV